jgi:hypothetical protein
MSEKRVYQDKMLNSEKEIVVCNWERGDGKTYSIFNKILQNRSGKYLYISPFEPIALQEHIRKYVDKNKQIILDYRISRDRVTIEFAQRDYEDYDKNAILEIFCIKPNTEFKGQRNIKMAFCDECYLDKKYIDSILKPMDVKQVYFMLTNDDFEYIDSRNSTKVENFYEKQIEELMIEYSNIPKNERTTLTRENILKQIKVLQDMVRSN